MGQLKKHLNEIVNKSWNYAGRCKTQQDHIMNAVLGLGGEAGEIVDLHKKMFYHTPDDTGKYREKLKHELGDLCFYLVKLLELHGLKLSDVLQANREKLESRHPELGKVKERFGKDYIQ